MRLGIVVAGLVCVILIVFGCAKQTDPFQTGYQLQQYRVKADARAARGPDSISEPRIMPITYFTAGQLLEEQKHFREAIVLYRKAIELNREFIAAYSRLGLCLDRIGHYQESEGVLIKALEIRPDVAFLHNNLGFSLMLQKRWADAERELRLALQLRPDYLRARTNLGLALAKDGKYAEAFEQFRSAVGESRAHYNLGMLYQAKGLDGLAADSYRQALALEPDFAHAKRQLEKLGPRLSIGESAPVETPISASRDPVAHEVPAKSIDGVALGDSLQFAIAGQPEARPQAFPETLGEPATAAAQQARQHIPVLPERDLCRENDIDRVLEQLWADMKPCDEDEYLEQFVFIPPSRCKQFVDATRPALHALGDKAYLLLEQSLAMALRETVAMWRNYEGWVDGSFASTRFDVALVHLQHSLMINWSRHWRRFAEAETRRIETGRMRKVSLGARRGVNTLLEGISDIGLTELKKYDFDASMLDEAPPVAVPVAHSSWLSE